MATARHEVMIDAPSHKVWALLGDVSKWPAWHKHVTEGRMLKGDVFYPGATFQYVHGGKPYVGTVTQIEQRKTLAWRAENVRHIVRLEPVGESTRVVGEQEVSGFMASLRKSKAEQEAAQACAEWLASLKEAAEAGS